MLKIVFVLLTAFSCLFAQDCKKCHNIESFDKVNHDFDCKECHLLPEKRGSYDHEKDIIARPDSLEYAPIFCAQCHQEDINNLIHSNHVTMKNAINQTRTLWGFLHSDVTKNTLPEPPLHVKEPKDLVDDFLRRKCLKCHIGNQGSGEMGMYRGKGCMSCHMEYGEDGRYVGSDLTMKGKKPYGKKHSLSSEVPMSACLSCHNKIFVGGDYLGLFPVDHDKSYRAPITKDGKFPKKIYGARYHHLNQDIHYQNGLTCKDCHPKENVMEDKKAISCTQCHQDISQNEAHASYHENIDCSACHASWQMSNYELSVFRDDMSDYEKWKNLLEQEDAYLENFLKKAMRSKEPLSPMMPDWLSKELKKGVWYSGWRMRRWEHVLLGNDSNGKVKLLRPFFQYRISYRNSKNEMVLDDVHTINGKKIEAFIPFVPHTITKEAKSCESCHENPLILNPPKDTRSVLDLLTGEVKNGSKLTDEQLKKLQSEKYRKIRAKMLF
jgi:hypothetical protein